MSALILPEPPQSFDAFGLNLVGYLAQPGSAFIVNRYGFDTGHRKFIVNTDVADLGAFALGTPDFKYPRMYVQKVTNEVIGGPWTIADIEYLGQIYSNKPHEISTDADIRRTSINFTYIVPNAGFLTLNFALDIPEVTVQDVYVTDTMPDMNVAGAAIGLAGSVGGSTSTLIPPISIPPPSLESFNTVTGLPSGAIRVFRWWWELRRRALRIAGIPPAASTGSSTIKRFITGNITLSNGSKNFVGGANTKFLTELAVGEILFARNPPAVPIGGLYYPTLPALVAEFTAGFTVATVDDDHHGTLTAAYADYGIPTRVNFTGQFYTFDSLPPPPTPLGSPVALYEVTDSWKRIVLVLGEPLANALSQ